MKLYLEISSHRTWGKARVAGRVIGYSKGEQIQEHLETIYYIGRIRLIVKYNFKFMKYD